MEDSAGKIEAPYEDRFFTKFNKSFHAHVRIVCSESTASFLFSTGHERPYPTIDFHAAIGEALEHKHHFVVSDREGLTVRYFDGYADIRFICDDFNELDIIPESIQRYNEIEWWVIPNCWDVFHYYFYEGEVVEDDELYFTSDYFSWSEDFLSYDDNNSEIPLFYEKKNQKQFINFHPDKTNEEYQEYLIQVKKIADDVMSEGYDFLYRYDYQWEELYRSLDTSMIIRLVNLKHIDTNTIKCNVMSYDILEEIQNRLFPYNQKLYHAIFSFVIGDALGVPYEFEERGSFRCFGMRGHGSHDQPAGTWSDDTSMTLATLKSIKDNDGRIVIEDIKNNFLKWLNEGAFTAHDEVFDVGHATLKALMTGEPRMGEYENGNGSLMRILPLAFTDCSDDEIRAVSAITHGHHISMDACVIYVHVARRLLAGEDIEDIIPTLVYDEPFHRLRIINQLSVEEIRSSGYVVDTLEAALWALSHKDFAGFGNAHYEKGFDETILEAVNLGEDTDTVAAVTGGLAGIIYGMDSERWYEWFEVLQNKEQILQCLM